jgi:anthranilate phosphoribosyltransferase
MGMDEFTVCGPTVVGEVIDGEAQFGTLEPAAFGLPTWPLEALAGSDGAGNAAILRAVFAGERGARRDVVVMNAAAVLIVAGLAGDFTEAAELAGRTIDSRAVMELVAGLAGEKAGAFGS